MQTQYAGTVAPTTIKKPPGKAFMFSEGFMSDEVAIRLAAFASIFAVMALWELAQPRRALTVSKKLRWFSNITIVIFNTVLGRIVFPMAPVAFAALAMENGWGVFNILQWNGWAELAIAVILMDFAIWLQHVMVHAIPMLWRLHRMHHADLDYDVTTGARFHPIEILLSLGIKFCVIALTGASPEAVLVFEVLLNATAMFNHANVRLPLKLDAVLRLFVVTPDMHRVHHSAIPRECNSNFGFNLPWWDQLFGTYIAQPEMGHADMTIGLDMFREERDERLDQMLIQPFRDAKGEYAINRRDWD